MGFSYKDGDVLEGQVAQKSNILTTVNLGFGYRLSKNRLLNVTGRAGVGGNNAVQVSVNMSERF